MYLKPVRDCVECPLLPGSYDCRGDCVPERVIPVTSPCCFLQYNSVYAPSTTGVVNLVNGITAGFNFWQRNSDRVRLWRLMYRMFAYTNYTPTLVNDSYNNTRLSFVVDRQCNGGVATTYDDIFQMVDAGGGNATNSLIGQNWRNRDRFHIIWDRQLTTGVWNGIANATGTPAGGAQALNNGQSETMPLPGLSGVIDLGGLACTFYPGSQFPSDIALYFTIYSDQSPLRSTHNFLIQYGLVFDSI